ncbi:hypothetical protein, partial [Escherichia coli]
MKSVLKVSLAALTLAF